MTLAPTRTLIQTTGMLWDVVVVGAGPAGALSAGLLAGQGVSVLLVDKADFPRAKVCGCCLTARARAVLARHNRGEVLRRNHAVPLERLSFAYGRRHALLPLSGWAALSREALDAALIRSAVAAGADFLPGVTAAAAGVSPTQRRVTLCRQETRVEVDAKLVLAADGLGGRFITAADGTGPVVEDGSRIGAGAVAPDAPAFYTRGTVFMACGRGGYLGIVRLEDDRVDIAAALDPDFVRAAGGPGEAATALLRDTGWPPVAFAGIPWRGTLRLTRRAPALAGDRLFVLGDAAGYVEPFTGEGITWALTAAAAVQPLACQAVRTWTPSLATAWVHTYRRTVADRQGACRWIARVLRRPVLIRTIVSILHHAPGLGAPLLRYIGGT
jgi:flavin-dependent dehydrogenase